MKERVRRLEEIYQSLKVELVETTVNNLVISNERKYVKYSPEYQRNYVWSQEKATNLIETVLMKGIIPPLIVIKKGKNIELIDGRQRYESLLKFYNNKFKLKESGLQVLRDWSGRSFDELAPNLRTLFGEYKIRMIAYTVENYMDVTDKELELVGRDLFRRYNFGMTALKSNEIARAKYHYDGLTRKFKQYFIEDSELYKKSKELFAIGEKKKLEEREKINLLLIVVRKLITMPYIPIVGERNVQCHPKMIDKYYSKFIIRMKENEREKKIIEFKKIIEKLYCIKEKLKETECVLKDDIQFFNSVYWMFSMLYNTFSTEFYDFNIDKFCHYIQDKAINFFNEYNSSSGLDTEKRISYLKNYIEKTLNLNINTYLENIKANKKSIAYIKDTNISKDKDWYSPYLSQQPIIRRETMELKEIVSLIKQNRFIVRPEYQRGEVIDKIKASRIIESIILGVKLPPIYLYTEVQENGLSTDIVLDGQQRLIDILKYIGEPVTNQNFEYIRTSKDKYALKGINDLEGLKNTKYEELPSRESNAINNYVFEVIRIDKKGNENVDVVDIFIRLNQNPCPIKINSFEMWNSYDSIQTINKIKEIAKYEGFKQQCSAMREEEIVTTLAYMHYMEVNIKNMKDFFNFDIRTDNKYTEKEKSILRISAKSKEGITKLLENMVPNSKEEKEFLISVDSVNNFIDKLKTLSDNDYKKLIKILNPNKKNPQKGDKNSFYIMWIILQELDIHLIQTYKNKILNDLEKLFSIMQDMPKDKDARFFIDCVNGIINKYNK